MAIGNFYDDDSTDTLQLGDPNNCYAYYYIENVCIAKNSSDCDYLKQTQDINSINDKDNIEIHVIPNPSTSIFHVTFSVLPDEVEVFNSIGQLVYLSNVVSNNIKINSNEWAKGLYILKVKGEGGKHQSFKLIKQ